MKRRLLIVLLGFGTIFGFTTGFASVSHHWHWRAEQRRAAFEAHVADICVDAARRSEAPPARYEPPPAPRWEEPPPSDHPDWDRHDHHPRRHRYYR